jgi:hypothetical protein
MVFVSEIETVSLADVFQWGRAIGETYGSTTPCFSRKFAKNA